MSGNRVVLIDGWAGTPQVWYRVLPGLTAAGLSCRTLSWEEGLEEPEAAVAAALAGDWADDPAPAGGAVWLAGWSLGGMLALEAAAALQARDPGRIAGLVLIASTARMCADEDWPGVEARAIKAMKLRLRKDAAGQLTDFAALSISAAPGTVQAAVVQSDMSTTPAMQAAAYAQAGLEIPLPRLQAGLEYLLQKDLRPLLPALAGLPVVVLHGTADAVIPCASGWATAGQLPGAERMVLENAPHALPLTHPDAIISAIRTAVFS